MIVFKLCEKLENVEAKAMVVESFNNGMDVSSELMVYNVPEEWFGECFIADDPGTLGIAHWWDEEAKWQIVQIES